MLNMYTYEAFVLTKELTKYKNNVSLKALPKRRKTTNYWERSCFL